MDVLLSGQFFSRKFSFVNSLGKNDMGYVAFKVNNEERFDLVIMASSLEFSSNHLHITPAQVTEI